MITITVTADNRKLGSIPSRWGWNKKNHLKSWLIILTALLVTFAPTSNAQLITSIGNLGSLDFSVDSESTNAPHTQEPNYINFTGSFSLGATLGGLWDPAIPKDWSIYDLGDFGLLISITGTNPNLPYTVEFYDSNLFLVNTFTGTTAGAGTSLSFSSLTLSVPGTSNMNDILGIQFTFDASDAINMNWESIAVVPEPKTITLLTTILALAGLKLLIKGRKKIYLN
jgi:hypothetical protein